MKNYFEVKIKHFRVDEEGRERRIVESYLIDAVSFTDAEARMYKSAEIKKMNIVVVGITESKIEKIIIYDDGDTAYKARIAASIIDEDSGREKRIKSTWLIFAEDINSALVGVNTALEQVLVSSQAESISLCNICEVIEEG